MGIFVKRMWIILCIVMIACDKQAVDEKEVSPELPFDQVDLSSLASFQNVQNWTIAGNVRMDRTKDLLADTEPGEGILVSESGKKCELSTSWEHKDCDIKLDFMLSKGSSVSLLFQGRYKILLQDDWANQGTSLKCGVVYQTADSLAQPALNACKAPGLWQHLYIKFKASHVATDGNKNTDASFTEVYLNGWPIHHNIALAGPVEDVSPAGDKNALWFISEQGPVAIKNIQYKSYSDERITYSDANYAVFKGLYKNYDTLSTFQPLRTGKADSLHWKLGEERQQLVIEGKMNVPTEGDYLFRIRAGGPAWLLIDGKEIVNNNFTRDFVRSFDGITSLLKGEHSFKIIYANYDESLVVEYEGPDMPLTTLTSRSSERQVNEAPSLEYIVTSEPGIQRGFFTHKGKVNTYTMSVGIPGGLNYAYDMNTYSILAAWRGKFLDVSNMWEERGESQMQLALGAPLEFPGAPSLLQLSNEEDFWTDTVEVDNSIYATRSYRLGDRGLPVFSYIYKETKIEDQFLPADGGAGLKRKVAVAFTKPAENLYFMIGSGKRVEELPGGIYAIDDKEYFIEAFKSADGARPTIVRSKDGNDELLLPISGGAGESKSFEYSIIW